MDIYYHVEHWNSTMILAQATNACGDYSSSTYGTSDYGECVPTSGGLSNTGIAVTGLVVLACLILAAGIIMRVWHRKKSSQH